jgi:hypothetical protein
LPSFDSPNGVCRVRHSAKSLPIECRAFICRVYAALGKDAQFGNLEVDN